LKFSEKKLNWIVIISLSGRVAKLWTVSNANPNKVMVPDLVGRSEINGFELSLCEAQETTGFMEDCLEDTG